MIIAVGSTNPVKVKAAQQAAETFDSTIVVRGRDVPSGVSAMPMSKEEVRKGARTRAINALATGADLGIGMEGGMQLIEDRYYLTSSVYACTDDEGAWGGEVLVRIPPHIVDLVVNQGIELGTAMDKITGREGTKKQEGAIYYLTGGRLTRMQVFRDATIMALAPLLHR